jgi:hypothetical protein
MVFSSFCELMRRLFAEQSKDGDIEHVWSPVYRIVVAIAALQFHVAGSP